MNAPLSHAALPRTPNGECAPVNAADGRANHEAEEALARFRAQWPAERCRDLGDALCGTPAEREAAAFRIAARAMERNASTPADHAVRGLLTDPELLAHSKEQRKFERTNRGRGA